MILCICPNPSVDMFAWIDDMRSGDVNRIQKEQRFPGGKGVHVALAVAELGEEAHVLGFWGGATGKWIKDTCQDRGVVCHGPEVEGWSRTCITFRSSGPFHESELLGAGPEVSAADLDRFVSDYQNLIASAGAVCMSGSWPQGAGAGLYAELVSLANVKGKISLLDTAGESLRLALAERPTVVHQNRAEIQSLFRIDDIRNSTVQLSRQCSYAAVTSGADGLYLAHDGRIVHAKCTIDKVYSAVGSGDCLLAGLAVALTRQMSITDAARLAVACGTANCLREDLGMFYRKDVDLLMPRVEVSHA